MLASVLPGFRDFRTPFAVGVLWLSTLWVIAGGLLPSDLPPEPGLLRRIYEFSESLGVTTSLTIVGFVAYFIGIVTTKKPGPKYLAWASARLINFHDKHRRFPDIVSRYRYEQNRLSEGVESELALASRVSDLLQRLAQKIRAPGLKLTHENGGVLYQAEFASLLVKAALDSPQSAEVELRSKDELNFEQYGRYQSEAEFRFNVVWPLAILTPATTFQLIPWAGAFVITLLCWAMLGVVLYKGTILAFQAREHLALCVSLGFIRPSLLRRLDKEVKQLMEQVDPQGHNP